MPKKEIVNIRKTCIRMANFTDWETGLRKEPLLCYHLLAEPRDSGGVSECSVLRYMCI